MCETKKQSWPPRRKHGGDGKQCSPNLLLTYVSGTLLVLELETRLVVQLHSRRRHGILCVCIPNKNKNAIDSGRVEIASTAQGKTCQCPLPKNQFSNNGKIGVATAPTVSCEMEMVRDREGEGRGEEGRVWGGGLFRFVRVLLKTIVTDGRGGRSKDLAKRYGSVQYSSSMIAWICFSCQKFCF